MAMICSDFEWIDTTMPSVQRDDFCHDLELGAAMWGITTDPEAKRAIAGDTSSDDETATGLGNMLERLTNWPVGSAFSSLCPVSFASQPPEPFIDPKTRGFEWGFNWLSSEQDTMSGPYIFGKEQAGLRGMSWNFGSSWTAGKTLETFLSSGLPSTINSRSPFDRECFSPVLGPVFHLGLNLKMTLGAPGHGDTSAHHPAASPSPSPAVDHRLERMTLQSAPYELETVRLTPGRHRVSDTTVGGLRAHSGLGLKIDDYADSIGTECSYLGLGKRRTDVGRGYFALRHRIAPQRMTTLSCGEVRACTAKPPNREKNLKRLVECKVLIR
jgi:hypothetical protein